MDINKAIRKQNKSYKRFMLIMCFIFFALPIVLHISDGANLFLIGYLFFIETLILASVLGKKDKGTLKYEVGIGKITIWQGINNKKYNISCDKVVFVHAESTGMKWDIDIILITNSRFRNKNISAIDQKFLREHAYVSQEYTRIKRIFPEENYYYIIISKGGYLKYKLLKEIFRNSVNAKYSDEAIECIRLWQN